MNSFKDNWLREDERCPNCNQVTKRVKGITKQNLKRLITPQFNMNELLITFMLIMVLVLAFAYQSETKQCREWIGPMFESDEANCLFVCEQKCQALVKQTSNTTYEQLNFTKFNELLVTNETNVTG